MTNNPNNPYANHIDKSIAYNLKQSSSQNTTRLPLKKWGID